MRKKNYFGKAMAIAMMLLSLTFVSCYESDNPLFLDLDSLVPGPPLTLEAANEGGTMNVTFENTLSKPIDLQYSLDGGQSWQALNIKAGKPGYTDKSSGKHDKRPASLTYVKCLATSIASDATTSPTYNWLRSVPASGTFVKDASVDYGSGEFWDTTTQFGSTTKCAAQDVANWTWKNN